MSVGDGVLRAVGPAKIRHSRMKRKKERKRSENESAALKPAFLRGAVGDGEEEEVVVKRGLRECEMRIVREGGKG